VDVLDSEDPGEEVVSLLRWELTEAVKVAAKFL
jgi:hypothetical protein